MENSFFYSMMFTAPLSWLSMSVLQSRGQELCFQRFSRYFGGLLPGLQTVVTLQGHLVLVSWRDAPGGLLALPHPTPVCLQHLGLTRNKFPPFRNGKIDSRDKQPLCPDRSPFSFQRGVLIGRSEDSLPLNSCVCASALVGSGNAPARQDLDEIGRSAFRLVWGEGSRTRQRRFIPDSAGVLFRRTGDLSAAN